MSVLPNAVGRLDPVVEAIRDGDRDRASQLTLDEYVRLERNATTLERQARKIRDAANACLDFQSYVLTSESGWGQARRACGWSGVDGPVEFKGHVKAMDLPEIEDGMFGVIPPVRPALKAEHLPDGTKFILGGDEYERRHATSTNGWIRTSPLDGVLSWCYFSRESIQELIDRGVLFELPEGGA